MKIESILVPTDFSEHADKAFETAVDLAKTFGARIELLHAYDFGQWDESGIAANCNGDQIHVLESSTLTAR